jgi:hypothetical protein
MSNILTTAEAANTLRCEEDAQTMLDLLPLVDEYIHQATGHDWADDLTIDETAKSAARMLLTVWHENPGMMASGLTTLSFGLRAALSQLEAKALRFHRFEGLNGAGSIPLPNVKEGDLVSAVVGIVGVTGNQAAKFESVITVDGYLQQTSALDLSDKYYRAYIIPLEAL